MGKRTSGYQSLVEQIGKRLIILLLLLFLISGLLYQYTTASVEENRITAAESMLKLYGNDIDNRLKNAADSLDKVLYASSELSALQDSSESVRYFASMEIIRILEEELAYNENADAYFIVEPETGTKLVRLAERVHTAGNRKINNFLESESFKKGIIPKNGWYLQEIGDQSAFVKVYQIKSIYVGVMILDTTAMEHISQNDPSDGSGMLLTDENGKIYYQTDGQKDASAWKESVTNDREVIRKYDGTYILVTKELQESGAKISNYIERRSLLKRISIVPYLMLLLAFFTICYLVYIYGFLRKRVIGPIDGLVVATQKVGQGEWTFSVEENADIQELAVLEKSFNEMTAEIKNLKIASYEEQMERQKIELRYLQMQMKPHFYLNAMTTIHSMTYKNKNEQIREFVEALSDHMRYTIREGISNVTVAEEIRHVKEYIKMQEIRYTDNIFYMDQIDPETEEIRIPQFLILTFVENTFKYAMDVEKLLSVFIACRKERTDGGDYLTIRIEDNGPGYPEEMLEKLNGENVIKDGTEKGLAYGM